MKVTVGFLKGGAARTTTAIYLALALAERTGDPVLLVDADPANGTAYEWKEDAGEHWPASVDVQYWPIAGLGRHVGRRVTEGTEHVVIDTGNASDALSEALKVTDHLVIPLAPSGTESTRLTPTLHVAAEVARHRPIELSILLTRTIARSRSRADVRQALVENMGLAPLDTEIPRLERFANAYGSAPTGDELDPYRAVIEELEAKEKDR